VSIVSTVPGDLSIFNQNFDRCAVYVDLIDTFVTCVENMPSCKTTFALCSVLLAGCGGSGDPAGNGQNTNTLMGAIVRLDIGGGSSYRIPAGNPLESNPVCTGEQVPLPVRKPTLGAYGILGGFVYRGSAIANLAGWYVFGDFVSGRLFGIPEDSEVGETPESFGETGLQIVSFGQAANGELYVLHFGGTIHQIEDAP
jgi:hypothetical protein